MAFILADMGVGVELARLAWMKAAWEVDNGTFFMDRSHLIKIMIEEPKTKILEKQNKKKVIYLG